MSTTVRYSDGRVESWDEGIGAGRRIEIVRIGRIDYEIIRETENPAIKGRYLVHLKRPNGEMRYVATRYEDGSYSSVVTNSFDHFADASKMITGGLA